jgi:hypothetical protein
MRGPQRWQVELHCFFLFSILSVKAIARILPIAHGCFEPFADEGMPHASLAEDRWKRRDGKPSDTASAAFKFPAMPVRRFCMIGPYAE